MKRKFAKTNIHLFISFWVVLCFFCATGLWSLSPQERASDLLKSNIEAISRGEGGSPCSNVGTYCVDDNLTIVYGLKY